MDRSVQHRKCIGYIIILIICVFHSAGIAGQVIIEKNETMSSTCLKRQVNYSLLLPHEYFSNQQSYPVIYLLHGFGGDNVSWISRCNINLLIDSLLSQKLIHEYIYVMPDAGNSYYLNNFDSSFMYEDFFIKELVPRVDSLYRTKPCRESRTLMGLSMGGFGSILLAIKYSDLFGSVVALSAPVRDSAIFKSLPQDLYETYFATVFGSTLNGGARITKHWKANSPYFLIDSTRAENLKKIHWYIDCGMDDERLPANESFHDLLMRYKIPHEFHMRPGKHNWAYWYRSSIYGLIFLSGISIRECPE